MCLTNAFEVNLYFVMTNSLTVMCVILLADHHYDLKLSEDGKSVNVEGMVTPLITLTYGKTYSFSSKVWSGQG